MFSVLISNARFWSLCDLTVYEIQLSLLFELRLSCVDDAGGAPGVFLVYLRDL